MDPKLKELIELDKLKNQEIITEEEYNTEKRKILNPQDFFPNSQMPYNQFEQQKYAGFFQRLGSALIDIVILIPISFILIWGNEQSRLFTLYYFVPGLIFTVFYHVYLVKKYGGTPGKLILNIKITKLDETDVGYKEAIIRQIINLIFGIALQVHNILAVLNMTDDEYFSYNWITRGQIIIEYSPMWYYILLALTNIWFYGEFIVMLTNKERRAIHDFMAGTIVINKKVQPVPVNQGQWNR